MSDLQGDDNARKRSVGGTSTSTPPAGDRATLHESTRDALGMGGNNACAHQAGELQAGSRVAEFEIGRLVGQGGFGAVYEAWDTELLRVVAVKEYLPMSLSMRRADGAVVPLSERTRETFDRGMRSFINEARLLAQFDHPSLLKVYRFWQERGTAYMVMPLYRGATLGETLEALHGGADEAWLLRLMDGVTKALALMHDGNCYHRDISPDNIILLEGSGRPVLLDFGAARRVIADKTQVITAILKPDYAPVEQYAKLTDMSQGPWTDVYALAAVMHVAITGHTPPPSVARLLADNYARLANNEALRARYSQRFLSAIDYGLGVRPESRPQSMSELRKALGLGDATTFTSRFRKGLKDIDALGDGTPLSPIGSSSRAAKPHLGPLSSPSGRKGKLTAVVAAVLFALMGGTWWWLRQGAGESSETDAIAAATATKEPASSAPASADTSAPPIASTAMPSPSPPVPPPIGPVTPSQSLQALANGATPGFQVTATPRKPEVTIGKDKLAFDVRSNRGGYVYVFLLSTGNELILLFPNLLDKRNKITPGASLSLPRASWPMSSGGPAGTNQFAVLVSEHERDFSQAGVQSEGVFPQFPLPVLAALEATRGTAPAPLLGRPICARDSPCKDVYGVGSFEVVER
jgi:serine/threonine protein kinase